MNQNRLFPAAVLMLLPVGLLTISLAKIIFRPNSSRYAPGVLCEESKKLFLSQTLFRQPVAKCPFSARSSNACPICPYFLSSGVDYVSKKRSQAD
ncbi:hypothetical protein [Neisseria sp.]|uniref:hypothetical protein n=1 Tax=Neisseria sp. TaxID=192066 RepID=UPI0026DB5799|nr:hypothetical protein [Neisseria sp.]MDO4907183.1 hypothetical protein [Neisseria sp.]